MIIDEGLKGIFFPDDGLLDSHQLSQFLLWRLKNHPAVELRLDAEVKQLDVNREGICRGVTLKKNGEFIPAAMTILAMGMANKHLLAPEGIQLPPIDFGARRSEENSKKTTYGFQDRESPFTTNGASQDLPMGKPWS